MTGKVTPIRGVDAGSEYLALIVEPGPFGKWHASFVDLRTRFVTYAGAVDAAPLTNPNPRCYQRLASRLMREVGEASTVALAIERFNAVADIAPALLSSYPAPMLAVSPLVALARSAPLSQPRFMLLDFASGGAMAVVTRTPDGKVADLAPYDMDLIGALGIEPARAGSSGDVLTDIVRSHQHQPPRETMIHVLRALTPVLDAARAFGAPSLVCSSNAFADSRTVAAFLEAASSCLKRPEQISVARPGDRALGATDHILDAAAGPGTWMSRHGKNHTLAVVAQRPVGYKVTHVQRPIFDPEEPALANMLAGRPALIVVDGNVDALYGEALRAYAARYLDCVDIHQFDGSETHKTWDQVEEVCAKAIRCGLRRDGVVVAVGGGVTLDATGVAASLYRRGVRFARVPTTLLGMVDVCVGIKQGINLGRKKNILGAFYPPYGCINDLSFLRTLDRRQLACGVAETVKMAIVCDAHLFDLMETNIAQLMETRFQRPKAAAEQVVIRAELAMMRELQPNLFEENLQRLVDFGHSFSPALEAASDYRLPHGEAVAIDMMICAAIASKRGLCDPSVIRRIARIYEAAALPLTDDLCDAAMLVESLGDIVIHRGGALNLVLPTTIGSATFVQEVTVEEVAAALAELAALAGGRPAAPVSDHAVACN